MKSKEQLYTELRKEHGIECLAKFLAYAQEQILSIENPPQLLNLKDQSSSESISKSKQIIIRSIEKIRSDLNVKAYWAYTDSQSVRILGDSVKKALIDLRIYDPDQDIDDKEDLEDYLRSRIRQNEQCQEIFSLFDSIERDLDDEESDERDRKGNDWKYLTNNGNCARCEANPCMCSDPF